MTLRISLVSYYSRCLSTWSNTMKQFDDCDQAIWWLWLWGGGGPRKWSCWWWWWWWWWCLLLWLLSLWFGMMWKGSVVNVQFVHARQWTSASSMFVTVVYLDPTCSPSSQNGRIPVVLDRHAPAGQRSFGQFFAIYLQLETLLGA